MVFLSTYFTMGSCRGNQYVIINTIKNKTNKNYHDFLLHKS